MQPATEFSKITRIPDCARANRSGPNKLTNSDGYVQLRALRVLAGLKALPPYTPCVNAGALRRNRGKCRHESLEALECPFAARRSRCRASLPF